MAFLTTFLVVVVTIIGVLGALLSYFHRRTYSYWKERGVDGPAPTPLVGNMMEIRKKGQFHLEKEWLAKYGKVYGIYQVTEPVLTLIDVELIKQVMIKDFHVFVNRDRQPFEHEIWSSNLFNSEDEQWKRIRAITSPSFTTGKLRGMHTLMNKCVDKLTDYFDRVILSDGGNMNIKEVVLGFTIDVIASTSFATETNANGDRTGAKNPVLENGVKLFDFQLWRFVSLFLLPRRFNILIGNSIGLHEKPFNFFRDLSREVIRQRTKGNQTNKRSDLVQLMMDAFVYEDELNHTNYDKLTATAEEESVDMAKEQNGASGRIKRSLTENEIIAQCILFFIAGFETTATSISNALYNLAVQGDRVQQRLYDELQTQLAGLEPDSQQYYETVQRLPYLEAVIKETLRMAPPVPRLQRRVGLDGYKLAGVPLTKDLEVNISTVGVHFCPDYYPDPERFEPERWLPENKHKLVPYTYLPFGAGPRNCIGMRFAYQEMRLCLAKIVAQYQFHTTPQTPVPLEFNKIGILSSNNIPLRVSKRH